MEQMITNLGFPIACCVGLAYYFVQKDKASREDVNKISILEEENKRLFNEISLLQNTLTELMTTVK